MYSRQCTRRSFRSKRVLLDVLRLLLYFFFSGGIIKIIFLVVLATSDTPCTCIHVIIHEFDCVLKTSSYIVYINCPICFSNIINNTRSILRSIIFCMKTFKCKKKNQFPVISFAIFFGRCLNFTRFTHSIRAFSDDQNEKKKKDALRYYR